MSFPSDVFQILGSVATGFGSQQPSTNWNTNNSFQPQQDPQDFLSGQASQWFTDESMKNMDPEVKKMFSTVIPLQLLSKQASADNLAASERLLDKQFGMQTLAMDRMLPWKMAAKNLDVMGNLGAAMLSRPKEPINGLGWLPNPQGNVIRHPLG